MEAILSEEHQALIRPLLDEGMEIVDGWQMSGGEELATIEASDAIERAMAHPANLMVLLVAFSHLLWVAEIASDDTFPMTEFPDIVNKVYDIHEALKSQFDSSLASS